MKKTIDLYDFRREFADAGRDNQFSYEALEVLFDWLEEVDPDTELDVIALCCEFCEMSLSEVLNSYDDITDEELTDDNETEMLGYVTDYLNDNTSLCGLTPQNTFVFMQF